MASLAPVLALTALLIALVLSMTTHVNVGLVSIAFAWIVGIYVAKLSVNAVVGGFPSALFITLAGVTLLFGVAKANGTLEILAGRAASLVRGHPGLLPLMFFVLAFGISTIGPGAIASVALVAPLAMTTGARAGVSHFLTAIMVGTGANAGNLSPVSSVGAMVNTVMAKAGMPGYEWRVWGANFAAHLLVALAAYALFGGWALLRHRRAAASPSDPAAPSMVPVPTAALNRSHWTTIGIIATWMVAVIVFKVHVGLAAFAAATLLILMRAADEREAIRGLPLDVILMVCGVSMLIAILETTGGLDLFTALLGKLATPTTVNGVIAFVTGVVSTYSSTSGVVLPAFLPMVPGLVREVGGGDPVAVALSINVGSALVDVSPLSTLGALCVAAVADRTAAQRLFRQLLIWGFSMAVVGAILCQLLAGVFAHATIG